MVQPGSAVVLSGAGLRRSVGETGAIDPGEQELAAIVLEKAGRHGVDDEVGQVITRRLAHSRQSIVAAVVEPPREAVREEVLVVEVVQLDEDGRDVSIEVGPQQFRDVGCRSALPPGI